MLQFKLLSIDEKLRKQNVGYYNQSIDKSKLNKFKLTLNEFIKDIDDLPKDKKLIEESLKEKIIDLLKDNFYSNNQIDIIDKIDLAILDTINATNTVEVIFELKTPQNSGKMISKSNPNAKALNQLVHYYMQQRLAGNDELKHLIATNGFEWYIFDAVDFEKLFFKNDTFFKQYEKWDKKQTVDSTTVSVYDKINNFLDNNEINLDATYFDLRDYQQYLNSSNEKDIENIITLYKIFSPQHLLKLSFANDSNTLNKEFYNELLYILGLEERTENVKNIISRANANNRQSASLIENTINQLKIKANITDDDQLFEIALELCITWLNRILFLKLLEGQLIKFHNDDKVGFSFMNIDKIKEFDDLNELFFEVLAIPEKDRSDNIKEKYKNVPYLNSSLFELTNYEREYITINSLKDSLVLPIFKSTVLKDANGKPRTDKLLTLNYLFEFLNSYDFSSDSGARVQRDNRPIINAAVLGLIFEKINGYKDGSYFTPGYITEYMCRESISRAVVQKFKENENQEFDTLDDVKNYCSLHHKVEDIKRFNGYINSLRICDPAVGSGHFLVSALNVLLAIKSELNILADDGVLIDYDVSVDNDELIVINKNNNKPYKYFLVDGKKPTTEVQNIQRVLFNEKVQLIENCLFGVDINSKSVQITRLRLWIELLKNAYYKAPDYKELETLPNIDINIKCGDSLISRYTLDSDLKPALRNSIWNIVTYKNAIASYHKPRSKSEKTEILKLINDIKNNFETEISQNHPLKKKLLDLKSKLFDMTQTPIFEYTENEKLKLDKDVKNITNEINKIESELEDIKNGEIYKNAFEWRFEFPDVLDDDGNYIGFDVVIGNPPYISTKGVDENYKKGLKSQFGFADDLYSHFFFRGIEILKNNSILSYISSKTYWTIQTKKNLRDFLLDNKIIEIFDTGNPFESAMVDTAIIIVQKSKNNNYDFISKDGKKDFLKPNIFVADKNLFYIAPNHVFFIPNEVNKKIANKYFGTIHKLFDEWWDKISTSKNIEKNKIQLEKYRATLKPGDITLLGLITEGGQGLATGNNGKYVGVKDGTKWADNVKKQRPEKLLMAQKFCIEKHINDKNDADKFLNSLSEAEIRSLFDELKEKYGRDIFGQGWLFRIVSDDEIAEVDSLTDDEKLNGIDGKRTFVPYDKGDKDGNRWWAPTPYYIDWSKENVKILQTDPKARWQGYQYFFREGFCWTDVNSTYLKSRLKEIGVYDVLTMSLFTATYLPDLIFVSLINSSLLSEYVDNFVNSTSHFQINDARQLPIVIPNSEQLNFFENIFNRAVSIQKDKFAGNITEKDADKKLNEIQKELDKFVEEMYL
jgi:hypothetical protein